MKNFTTNSTHQIIQNRNIEVKKPKNSLSADWVKTAEELKEVQKLRYKIFKNEMGASFTKKTDADPFDDYCEHLIIKDNLTEKIIATYRILTPIKAKEIGQTYSEQEFEIGPLKDLIRNNQMIEAGRACIHKKYRNGGTIMLLWAEIAKFMQTNKYRYLIGCSSVSIRDGGHNAANLHFYLKNHKQYIEDNRIYALNPLPTERLVNNGDSSMPPLLNGYLRLGANVIGGPAWDPDFQTADFLTLMDLEKISARYKKHFLK